MNRLIYLNKIVAPIEKEGVSTSRRVPMRASIRRKSQLVLQLGCFVKSERRPEHDGLPILLPVLDPQIVTKRLIEKQRSKRPRRS